MHLNSIFLLNQRAIEHLQNRADENNTTGLELTARAVDAWHTNPVQTSASFSFLFDFTIRYDTIRYDTVDLRALKSWRDGQLNLAHGPETKENNGKKNQNQKPSSSEETVHAKVREGNPGGRSKTKGVGFVKKVGFKPGVKERWSYRCTKWWIREAEVMGEGIGG